MATVPGDTVVCSFCFLSYSFLLIGTSVLFSVRLPDRKGVPLWRIHIDVCVCVCVFLAECSLLCFFLLTFSLGSLFMYCL